MNRVAVIAVIFVVVAIAAWMGYTQYKSPGTDDFLKTLSGEIVYTHRDDGVLNIYKISANSSGKQMLYHNDDPANANSMFPRWSADGTQIYFTAMKAGAFKTFVMNADGTNVQLSKVTNDITSLPSREPDIVGEQGNLYYVENGSRTQLYAFSGYDAKMSPGASEASWSPDKKYIVFQSCSLTGGCNIMVADKTGKSAVLAEGMQPDWGGVPSAQGQSTFDGKNATFTIDGKSVTLAKSVSEVPQAGSASKVTTRYFGNEATGDLTGDGLPDTAFLVTQDTGGSGLFYYAVVAIQTAGGYKTTNAVLIGDRVAPQSTYIPANSQELQVNYAERKPGEPMTAQPSVGATLLLKVTPAGVLEGLMK